nr:conjugal transfer protein TraC [Piscirickettsiaceae bacterium]
MTDRTGYRLTMSDTFSQLQSIIDQMHEVGIGGLQASDIVVDGRYHKFHIDGSNSRKKHGWYILSEANINNKLIVTGAFGDYRMGIDHKFAVKPTGLQLTDEEKAEYKKKAAAKQRANEKARKQKVARAKAKANAIWPKLANSLPEQNAYLKRKLAKGYGVRFSQKTGSLSIPIIDMGGALHGLQVIHTTPRKNREGELIEKDFFPFGCDFNYHFHLMGGFPANEQTPILIGEGYATCDSAMQALELMRVTASVFVAFNTGNLLKVAQVIREAYPNNPLIWLVDDDFETKQPPNPGLNKCKQGQKKFGGVLAIPLFNPDTRDHGTDWNDLHVTEGLQMVQSQLAKYLNDALQLSPSPTESIPHVHADAEMPSYWMENMALTKDGNPKADIANVELVLQNDKDWKGVIAYCDFSYQVLKLKEPPFAHSGIGEWTDADTSRLRVYLSRKYGFTPKSNDVDDAVLMVAQSNRFHPVQDYLKSLKWDGVPRIAPDPDKTLKGWLSTYLGASETEYHYRVGVKWLVGAVARVMRPPVKVDNILILEGLQGAGKSTILSILGGDWFSDTHFALGDKDGYQQMQGVWINEIAELDAFNKAESNRAKAFFAAETDRYRPSYGRRAQNFSRQCVFAGTTNQEHYLKDATGNRRYWPVGCYSIDLEALRRDRDQLWAEALKLYEAGFEWWVTKEEAHLFGEEQDSRFDADVWEDKIADWLLKPDELSNDDYSTVDIMERALGLEAQNQRKPEQTRVGQIMVRLKWAKKKKMRNGRRTWVYERPDNEVWRPHKHVQPNSSVQPLF